MSVAERVIVLAAGRSMQLDGMSKVLVRHPGDGRTVLDYVIDAFACKRITVVVGYRSVEIMQAYPQLDFVFNPEWALTNNAMSLGLALDDSPCYVVSGDIFVGPELISRLDGEGPDIVLTKNRERRSLSAIHCVLDRDGHVVETYQGPLRDVAHPESVGLFKLSTPTALRAWRKRCIRHANLFVGQLLPCDELPILAVPLRDETFFEINTPTDYLELLMMGRR